MSAKDVPWLIAINDRSNIAGLTKKQKLYYTLDVINVNRKSEVNDVNNEKLCVIPFFKSYEAVKQLNINEWNSCMSKNYIFDAFEQSNSHCLHMQKTQSKSLFPIQIDDELIDYVQLNEVNDKILNFILMNNSYFYYVSDIIEINNTLSLHGVLLNPLAELQSNYDEEIFNGLIMKHLENMFRL